MTSETGWIVETCEHDGQVGRCPMCRAEAEAAAERAAAAAQFDPRAAAAGERDED